MATYHNYLAFIGRADGDDESTVHLYENATVEQAREAFGNDVRRPANLFDHLPDRHEVYVDFVLVSTAPIVIEEQNV